MDLFLDALYNAYLSFDYIGKWNGFYGRVVTMKYIGSSAMSNIPILVHSFYFPFYFRMPTCLYAYLISNRRDLHYINTLTSHLLSNSLYSAIHISI